MASTFEIEYCLSDSERQKIIENGSVRLCVKWNDGVEQTKHFYHCLHCDRTFSRSGLFYHRRNINLTPQRKEALALRFLSNPRSQETVIRDEFERCFKDGELKRRVAISTSPNYPFEFTPVQWQDDQQPTSPVRSKDASTIMTSTVFLVARSMKSMKSAMMIKLKISHQI